MPSDAFRATAIPVSAATMATMLGFGMVVPALPLLTGGGSGAVEAGLVMSGFGVARLLSNVPAGMWVDRVGLRTAAATGLFILLAGSLFAFLPLGLPGLVAALAIQGSGSAFFSTAAMTSLILKAGPERRGAAMSWFQGSLLFAFAVGPLVGGVIVGPFGPHAPFAAQAVLAVAALLVVRRLPAAAPRPAAGASGAAPRSGRLLGPTLLAGGAMGFAAFFSRIGVGWTIIPDVGLHGFGLSTEAVGTMIGVGTAANLVAMPATARLIDRWGAGRTATLSAVVTVAALLLPLALPTAAALFAATALLMISTGAMIPAAGAVALKGVPGRDTGRAMGLFRTGNDLGTSLGPTAVPAIAAGIGHAATGGFAVAAVAVVLAGLVAAGLDRLARRCAA